MEGRSTECRHAGARTLRRRRKRPRPAETLALKGRWAGVPIDPLGYGSAICSFALRNLHKSPRVQVGGAPHTRRACKLHSPPTSGDWCRFRAADRGLRSHPTCRPLRSNAGMQSLGAPMRAKALPTCGNPSRQGSMDISAHRPCFPWFANLRIRRTKPPPIAATHGLRAHHARGGHAGCGRTPTCGDWCRFRAADRGLQLRSTCGRAAGREGARRLERADCGLRDATGASRMPDERFFTGNVARISTYAARSKT